MKHKKGTPPRWANQLLKWFCSKEVIETLEGDLHELYEIRQRRRNKLHADLWFVSDVLSSMRPFAIRRIRSKHSNMSMYQNYIKVSWRNLVKHKMYSTIKIGGLAIGIAACLLISIFVVDELNHDKDYPNADRIYRLLNSDTNPENPEKWTAHQPMVANLMKEQFPEVELAGRLIPYNNWGFAGDNQTRRTDRERNTYEEGF
ncbi:MAG: permease prefix domain 2-containing transporter, partial [Bacteroidota bacterium]